MTSSSSDQATLLQMIKGLQVSQCISAVAKLGIADLLKDGEQHSDALATATNTNKDAIYRLLRTLAGVGIFAETKPHYFKLTPLAIQLQSDVPNSLKAYAIYSGEELYQAWGNVMYSLQTGQNAFENLHGMNIFEYYQQNPSKGKIFSQAMTNLSSLKIAAILTAYDFSSIGKLVDIGGGNGRLLSSILQAYSTMTGVLFDQPDVIDCTSDFFDTSGMNARIQVAKGDFFKTTLPVGGNAYLLKHVLHNWDDEQAIAILKNCYQAMGEQQARLLVIETIILSENAPCADEFLDIMKDINMLVISPCGRERTEAEYKNLFEAAGFKLTKIVPTKAGISVIEGMKDQN